MRILPALTCAVFSTLLSLSFTQAGEWHSAGNSPMPPYYPEKPARYKCQIVVMTLVSGKQYRIDLERVFENAEFQQPGFGAANFTVHGEADPGMDGQRLTLRFSPSGAGKEDLHLSIYAVITDGNGTRYSAYSETQVARTAGRIQGEASVTVSPGNAASSGNAAALERSASVRVSCATQN